MFKTILNITKQQIINKSTLRRANSNLAYPYVFRSIFFLSQQKTQLTQKQIASQQQNIQIENPSAEFYKNSIRKVNINDKGRGKFTQHHLLNLIKLVNKPQQQPLLFQAYFNYLGHFTIFDSKVVDKMLLKSMSFEKFSTSNVLDIYKNHNYLAYFPNYKVTNTLINTLQNSPEEYKKLIDILISSPLIKFDAQILYNFIKQINNIETSTTIFSSLSKLIINRSALNLLDHIMTKSQILTVLITALKARLDNQVYKTTKTGSYFSEWCESLLENKDNNDKINYQLTIVGAYFQSINIFANNLVQIKNTDFIVNSLEFLQASHHTYQNKVIQHVQSLQISETLKTKLNQFKEKKDSQTTNTQAQ